MANAFSTNPHVANDGTKLDGWTSWEKRKKVRDEKDLERRGARAKVTRAQLASVKKKMQKDEDDQLKEGLAKAMQENDDKKN